MWLLWLLLGSAGECGRWRQPGSGGGGVLRSAEEGSGPPSLPSPASPRRLATSRAGGAADLPSPSHGCSPLPRRAGRGARWVGRVWPWRAETLHSLPSGRSRGSRCGVCGARVGRGTRREGSGASGPSLGIKAGKGLRPRWYSPGRPMRARFSLPRPSLGGGGRGGLGQTHRRGLCTEGKSSGPAWLYLASSRGISYFLLILIL